MSNNYKIHRKQAESALSKKYETTIHLLNVYLNEWKHRDAILLSQIYRNFYAILIIMILPNVTLHLNINIPQIIPVLFPVVGIAMTVIFCYASLGYAKRLEAIGVTYQNLIDTLPNQYRRLKLDDVNGKIYKIQISRFLCIILTFALLAVGTVMIYSVS